MNYRGTRFWHTAMWGKSRRLTRTWKVEMDGNGAQLQLLGFSWSSKAVLVVWKHILWWLNIAIYILWWLNIAILWTFVGFGLLFPEHVHVLGHFSYIILDGFLSGTLVEWNCCCPFTISNAVTQAHIGNGPKLCTPKVGWLKNKTQNIQNSVSPCVPPFLNVQAFHLPHSMLLGCRIQVLKKLLRAMLVAKSTVYLRVQQGMVTVLQAHTIANPPRKGPWRSSLI